MTTNWIQMAWAYLSLRQVLTIPYVVLTLAVAAIIGGFSYVAGSQAVSEELLRDMGSRISQAVDRHLVSSRVALDAVFPDTMQAPVYVDNRTGELVATRVKPILNAAGDIEGVAATDVSLKKLNDFVRALRVSQNGVAFVAERNGDLIASSSDDSLHISDGKTGRVNASHSSHELVRATYAELSDTFSASMKNNGPKSRIFDSPQGKIYAAVNVIHDDADLEWVTVVAVPRSDFMAGVVKNVLRTIAIGAALFAILLGLWILNWVSRDLRLLSSASRRLGEGHLYTPVGLACYPEDGSDADSLLFAADQEMYEHKFSERPNGIRN